MNDVSTIGVIGLLVLSYFLGTFPSALIVAKRGGIDVTAEGSKNPGTSNVVRLLGWRYGAVVMILDIGKGALAVGAAAIASGDRVTQLGYLCAYSAVIGHTFPITRKFVGGKGVATGGGAMYVLYPLMSLVLCSSWFVIRKVTGKSSIASLMITICVPLYILFFRDNRWELLDALGLVVLIVIRHTTNIKRLWSREENAA